MPLLLFTGKLYSFENCDTHYTIAWSLHLRAKENSGIQQLSRRGELLEMMSYRKKFGSSN